MRINLFAHRSFAAVDFSFCRFIQFWDKFGMEVSEKRVLCLLGRCATYMLLLFVAYLLLTYVILQKEWMFSENGPIEWTQFALLTLLFAILATNAAVFDKARELFLLLVSCAMLALAREQDKTLDKLIPIFGWRVIFFLAVPLVLLQFRNWHSLRRQLLAFATSPAMGVFLAAIMVIILLAQCIGDSDYLRAAMGDGYMRSYKTMFEESMELYGYLILLCGAFETILFAKQYQASKNMTSE